MNLLKKTALGILVLGLMLGACACSKRMSIDKVEKVAEECGLEETGDEERLQKDVGAAQDFSTGRILTLQLRLLRQLLCTRT